MEAHLSRGDQVGLLLMGTRNLAKVLPGRGPKQAARILAALTLNSHTADADRSDWDDSDVARRVLEHACSIDAEAGKLKTYEHEKLAQVALRLLRHAPVSPQAPWAQSATGRILRQYLLAFGIQPPPRGTSDRHHVEREIALALRELSRTRRPPTLIYLFGRPPTFETPKQLIDALSRIPKHRTEVRFVPILESASLLSPGQEDQGTESVRTRLVQDALVHRQRIAAEDGMAQLAKLGVKLSRPQKKRMKRPVSASADPVVGKLSG
jgi:hypothetical protein